MFFNFKHINTIIIINLFVGCRLTILSSYEQRTQQTLLTIFESCLLKNKVIKCFRRISRETTINEQLYYYQITCLNITQSMMCRIQLEINFPIILQRYTAVTQNNWIFFFFCEELWRKRTWRTYWFLNNNVLIYVFVFEYTVVCRKNDFFMRTDISINKYYLFGILYERLFGKIDKLCQK